MKVKRWYIGLIALGVLCGLSTWSSICDLAAKNKDVPFQFNYTCEVESNFVREPYVGDVDFTISIIDGTTLLDVPGTLTSETRTTGEDGTVHLYFIRHLERSKEEDHDFIQGVRVIGEITRNGRTYSDSARNVPLFWMDPRDTIKISRYFTLHTLEKN
jgi:hypothetical protein